MVSRQSPWLIVQRQTIRESGLKLWSQTARSNCTSKTWCTSSCRSLSSRPSSWPAWQLKSTTNTHSSNLQRQTPLFMADSKMDTNVHNKLAMVEWRSLKYKWTRRAWQIKGLLWAKAATCQSSVSSKTRSTLSTTWWRNPSCHPSKLVAHCFQRAPLVTPNNSCRLSVQEVPLHHSLRIRCTTRTIVAWFCDRCLAQEAITFSRRIRRWCRACLH